MQLTHRNLWLNATVFGLHTTISDRDVLLHTLPMFHANGWGMPFGVTGVGGRHIVLRQVDGAEILRRVDRHGVTLMCAAPAVVNAALDAASQWDGPSPGPRPDADGRGRCAAADAHDRARARRAGLGVHPDLRADRDLAAAHGQPHAGRVGRAGARTTGPASWCAPGAPALGVRLAVSPDGEVLSATNHNLDGYWDQPEETAKVTGGHWFHTGDGGYLDDDGYLVISDRKKDVIISGGENVSSIEVEDVLMSHPAVREVAVIGIPDEKWGELVTALVVTDGSGVSADELIAHCRGTLAGFKCPKRIEFVDRLPRTATGKLQKFKLREPFWAGRERQVG